MEEPSSFGTLLMVVGLVLLGLGVVLSVFDKIPWIGHLPGDIRIERDGFHFYFPLTTCILVSILLSILLNFLYGR